VPAWLKRQAYAEYGITQCKTGDYEVDHLIPLSLGGSNSIRNLWPESTKTSPWNSCVKDALERKLHTLVCAGQLDLKTAQRGDSLRLDRSVQKYVRTRPPAPIVHEVKTAPATAPNKVWVNTRSGQIDVVIRHNQGLIEHLVVVECKYWKDRVGRQEVDALAATIREVGADRGIIFSKEGFESGAITQAQHDHIELFRVRSLTDEEWGLPGREIEFFMHCHTASAGHLQLNNARLVVGSEPKDPNLQVIHAKTQTKIKLNGSSVETLEALIEKFAFKACDDANFKSIVRFQNSFDGDILIRRHVDITPPTPIQIFYNGGSVLVGTVGFDVGHKIAQTRIYFDRAKNFLFALAVEDVVRKTNTLASRRLDQTDTILQGVEANSEVAQPQNVLSNGSLIS
jgi:hypothetical protein